MSDTNNQQQANITLYCAGSNLEGLKDKALGKFGRNAIGAQGDSDREFAVKLQDNTLVKFSVMAKPEVVMQQNAGMANFFSKAPVKNAAVKQAAIHQINMFTAIIGITFPLTDDKNRTNAIINGIFNVASDITAFVLYPSMELFHPEGKLLISVKGETSYTEYYPIMCRDMIMPNVKMSETDEARAKKNNEILKGKGMPCPEGMPVSAFEDKCVIPDKETIVKRAVAIFAAAVKSEVYGSGAYENPAEKLGELLGALEERYGKLDFLSNEEKSYIDNASPASTDVNKFGWRYECCAILFWALNLLDIDEPNEIVDATTLGEIIWGNDMASLMEKAVVRDKAELLDKQDLVHRYDWACIEAQIKKLQLNEVSAEVVVEWHYALNWLTGVEGVTDWDKVPRKA